MSKARRKRSSAGSPSKKPVASPKLMLIGVGSLIAVSTLLYYVNESADTGDDTAVEVKRVRYDSLAECLADWNQPSDCGYVCEDNDADIAGATLASTVVASATAEAASAAVEADSIDTGKATQQAKDCSATSSHEATSIGSSGRLFHSGHWYGPYYTRTGTVYHPNGIQTEDAPLTQTMHGTEASLTVRESVLHAGGSAFVRSPHAVSVSESHAISRGGFTSGRGGGGHGFGGGHGSGGG
ncbi:hypothetical protein G3N95_01815 [Paraburkholderia sp. Tr-20389]|uniref:hypothetical protein n=1 Tax=Paraburkholderia sp. Tr-20389 TaxID=2703903 RepID=UPI00197E587D|nr:hypothetical protein [Paraburkholderia sp. Tr-20389]MBN3751658.1 hypothetical protein [Paraburkholderia sp. Tr-20389]